MIRQQVKDLLFGVNRWAVLPNQLLARWRFRNPRDPEGHYVHLGCGVHYIPGLINCDGNAFRKIDLWIDLRNRLPFADGSVACLYCSHTLEHLFPDQAIYVLKETRRVLKPGSGVARIVVPDFGFATAEIASGRIPWEFPRPFKDPVAQAINFIFCDGQHKYAYTFAVMEAFAREAGFSDIRDLTPTVGVTPQRYGKIELGGEVQGSLVVELRA